MLLLEKGRDTRTAVQVFVRGRAAERSHLKNVAVRDARGGPGKLAIDDADRPARLEALRDEFLVGLRQPKIFQAEVRHELHHEPILTRIVHVVQLYVVVRVEEPERKLAHARQLGLDSVGIQPSMRDGHQICLRQPRNAACGAYVHERPIG